jgi:HEAT repeat protein
MSEVGAPLDAALQALYGGDDLLAEAAVPFLAKSPEKAVPALQAGLASQDADRRWWTVRALATIDRPEARKHLRTALKDPDSAVRQCALLALRQNPSIDSVPELIKSLGSPDRLTARLAGDALIALGSPAIPALAAFLDHAAPAARIESARALARIGDLQAAAPLLSLLDEPSTLLRYWAEEGLERLGVGMVYFTPET